MIALPTIVSEDVVTIDNLVEGISFQPGLLYKIYVEVLGFHHANEVFVACVVIGCGGYQFAVGISG